MITEVFIPEVLKGVVSDMQVPVYPNTIPSTNFDINYQPGRNQQIIDSLKALDGGSLSGEKYPLIAVEMPISEDSSSGLSEFTFPRIVIAYLTKTDTKSEPVMNKYSSDGVFKNILRPCLREFFKRLAWSTHTSLGDPDAYECTIREQPCQQPIGEGLTDFVDIIEILNLKAIIYTQIKTC